MDTIKHSVYPVTPRGLIAQNDFINEIRLENYLIFSV